MQKITYDAQYFNPKDVLECGQIFRFTPFKEGYKVFSKGEACYVYRQNSSTVIQTENPDYFYSFFDLDREYASIIKKMESFNVPYLTRCCNAAKGLRLLKQDREESIFSFIISQNNNIPRIKKVIENICSALGEEREFMGERYYSFPTAEQIAKKSAAYFKALGAGYRDEYLVSVAKRIAAEGLAHLENLTPTELKAKLLTYRGIGPKVADCIALFGFGVATSFPVDTWIERLYVENFNGDLRDRKKINSYFLQLFKEYSGYAQQYLFYGKRANL